MLVLTSGASSPLMIKSCRRIQRSVPARTSCLQVQALVGIRELSIFTDPSHHADIGSGIMQTDPARTSCLQVMLMKKTLMAMMLIMRSIHHDVKLPAPQPLPCFPPLPNLHTPFFTVPNLPLYSSTPVGQMPGSFWVLCGACMSWGTIVT